MADPTQDYSEEARRRAAGAGEALPDGSYPMRTCREVGDAIGAYGRAPDSHRAQLAQLIRKRNAELQCGHKLDALDGGEVDTDAGLPVRGRPVGAVRRRRLPVADADHRG